MRSRTAKAARSEKFVSSRFRTLLLPQLDTTCWNEVAVVSRMWIQSPPATSPAAAKTLLLPNTAHRIKQRRAHNLRGIHGPPTSPFDILNALSDRLHSTLPNKRPWLAPPPSPLVRASSRFPALPHIPCEYIWDHRRNCSEGRRTGTLF